MSIHPYVYNSELTFQLRLNSCIDTHSVDRAEGSTEREIHTLPHTRWAAGPVDYGEGGGAVDRLGGARRSIWPEEKLCDLCLTETGSYRCTLGGKVIIWEVSIRVREKLKRLSTLTEHEDNKCVLKI